MSQVVNFPSSRRASLEADLAAMLKEQKAAGNLQPALIAMAYALQRELALAARTHSIPHALPMEVIMRGVAAVISGDASPYVQEKLVNGCCDLLEDRDPHGHTYKLQVLKRR